MGKVLKIREVGEKVLKEICDEVNVQNIDEETLELVEDLKATLEFGAGLGIAAPQVGETKRIIVVGVSKKRTESKRRNLEEIPITPMLNPVWEKLTDETEIDYEGCMSVPELRGKVERYKDIKLTYYDEKGQKIEKQLHGLFARIVQHECDHLDGIVYLERVTDIKSYTTIGNLNKYKLREDKN